MPDGLSAREWKGEREALREEIVEYRRIYDSGGLADDETWNAWVEDHPRFAKYWQWFRSVDRQEAYDASMAGDWHLLNWYFDGRQLQEVPPPVFPLLPVQPSVSVPPNPTPSAVPQPSRIARSPSPKSLWQTVREYPAVKRVGGVLLVCTVLLFGLAQYAQDLGLVDGFTRAHQVWHDVPVCSLMNPASKQEDNNGMTVSYASSASLAEIDACFSTLWRDQGLSLIDSSQDASRGPLIVIRRWQMRGAPVYSYGYYADKGQSHVILARR